MHPYSRLLTGNDCTVCAHPSEGLTSRDDVTNAWKKWDETLYEEIMQIALRFMPAEPFGFLNINVNGRDFALSTTPIIYDQNFERKKGIDFIVLARHRLFRDESMKFNAIVTLTCP